MEKLSTQALTGPLQQHLGLYIYHLITQCQGLALAGNHVGSLIMDTKFWPLPEEQHTSGTAPKRQFEHKHPFFGGGNRNGEIGFVDVIGPKRDLRKKQETLSLSGEALETPRAVQHVCGWTILLYWVLKLSPHLALGL